MKILYYCLVASVVILLGAPLTSCNKETFYSTENLDFSADTVVFDTVFTTVGSTTQQLKIYNRDNRTLNIQEIELVGGANSPYRINVDGVSGINHADLDLEAGDSLYIFVEVTLDPNNGTTPMVIEDQIRFRTNNTDQFVTLAAWGQDAYFHTSIISQGILDLNSDVDPWQNDKPHVIYGAAIIDSAQTLTIPEGTDIYLHKGAILYNYKGTLNIEGTLNNPVTLQGDRLESYYDDVSGQFFGIYLFEAQESKINYMELKNGTSGVHVFGFDASNTGPTVTISNSSIQNCSSYGTALFAGASIDAENCLIAKNGGNQVLLSLADFNFNQCHILGYSSSGQAGNVVVIQNFYVNTVNGQAVQYFGDINEGTITNSIIYGNGDYELAIDTLPNTTLNFLFANNLIRSDEIQTESYYIDNIWNQDPLFIDINEDDFEFGSNSPAVDAGNFGTYPNGIPEAIGLDIRSEFRPIGINSDIGCYELY